MRILHPADEKTFDSRGSFSIAAFISRPRANSMLRPSASSPLPDSSAHLDGRKRWGHNPPRRPCLDHCRDCVPVLESQSSNATIDFESPAILASSTESYAAAKQSATHTRRATTGQTCLNIPALLRKHRARNRDSHSCIQHEPRDIRRDANIKNSEHSTQKHGARKAHLKLLIGCHTVEAISPS